MISFKMLVKSLILSYVNASEESVMVRNGFLMTSASSNFQQATI